jgi:hypothetical protein
MFFLHEPVCYSCGKSLGAMSLDELKALNDCSEGAGCLCFDCDPDSAATVPAIFWAWHPGDVFVFGPYGAESEYAFKVIDDCSHLRMCERVCARAACLSSSTYLNNQHQNSPLKIGELPDFEDCPNCSQGFMLFSNGLYRCTHCETTLAPDDMVHVPGGAWAGKGGE